MEVESCMVQAGMGASYMNLKIICAGQRVLGHPDLVGNEGETLTGVYN